MFFDVALIDKGTGKMLATWAGLESSLKDALKQLMFRADGKMPAEANRDIRRHLDGADVRVDRRYGYVIRAAGKVQTF